MSYKEVNQKAIEIQRAVHEVGVLTGPLNGSTISGLDCQAGLDMNSYSESIEEKAKQLETSMFKTLFMGTFKNGKSTTINAILGKELLPVAATAATAVISQVVYGKNCDKVRIYKNGSDVPEIMNIDRFLRDYKLSDRDVEQIEDTGCLDRFSDVDYVTLENDSSLFEDGVQLIDSPGLEEAAARTKTTENFIPQANAIVFLLDATKLFSAKEKSFIKAHYFNADPKPRNVFFVVNRYNVLNTDADRERVKKQTKSFLKRVFTDEDGNFDNDLFEKRVFFVDAYGAFKMKEKGQVPIGTGMPEFQECLEDFLTSEDRVFARYQTILSCMAGVYIEAERNIASRQKQMRIPLEELEKNAAASQKTLAALLKDVDKIERQIDSVGKSVSKDIMTDLEKFLTIDIKKIWGEHKDEYDNKFGLVEMMKMVTKKGQEEVVAPMVSFIREFLQEQLTLWGERAGLLIQPTINQLNEEFDSDIKDFDLNLAKAKAIFDGSREDVDIKGANKVQLGLSLIQGDFSLAVENAGGGNFSWNEFAKHYAIQMAINVLVLNILGAGFPGLLVVEVVQICMGAKKNKDKLLDGIANQLFPKIAEELLNNKELITADIEKQFETYKLTVTRQLKGFIEEEKSLQERIIRDKKNGAEIMEKEIDREQKILDPVYNRLNLVYYALYNKNLDPSQIEKLAASVGNIEV
ncbi:MAG: dynamin family protein [Clostridiales bacterium]|nr:dynamin family protein [Clostridiales bacterium]